ncbi:MULTISPECIES: hypothetical protein [unclassified Streptomyces]|uniref:hypothetical protein n=1 Tax=unclassified Streptomyces TaxID=2593676 RepID=UPI0006F20604|nr:MULTISPECIES: hypothetical protein [unclassified Streptomyces]KQX59535.1 hypothetical protein ASD33_04515 [Streptomyces sp. Root1304]KRB00793.1 hypothetical protein ASE09_04520 [Streptomyces sp. Root66D1]
MNADRRLRPAAVALAAVALAAVLTGCQGGASASGAPRTAPAATAAPGSADSAGDAGDAGPTVAPAVKKPATTGVTKPAGKKSSAPRSKAKSKTKTAAPVPDCVDATPGPDDVDPDEIALYRIEELDGSTGKVNLVLQHGAWGCGSPDSDGAPFVVTGEESRWALDQAAYVTVTNPVVTSTENRRIGVQELIDWVDAHPDSGLVFRYTVGDDGAIHRLEQVFTP